MKAVNDLIDFGVVALSGSRLRVMTRVLPFSYPTFDTEVYIRMSHTIVKNIYMVVAIIHDIES